MQRLVGTLSRASKPAFIVGGAAAGTSQAHCRAPPPKSNVENPPVSPTKADANLSVVEGLEGWGFVKMNAPVETNEVSKALEDLATMGGVRRPSPPPSVSAHTPSVAAGPQIQEVHTDDEDGSSITSDGYNANLMMSTAESMEPSFYDHHGGELADPMDNLTNVVGNLLNNPRVMSTIQAELVQDPAFYALMRQVNPSLPPMYRPLITDVTSEAGDSDSYGEAGSTGGEGFPLEHLLQGLQRGMCAMAGALGEAFAHLGAFVRQLGDTLGAALSGARRSRPTAGRSSRPGGQFDWESVLVKVALAVAVIVMARRARVFV